MPIAHSAATTSQKAAWDVRKLDSQLGYMPIYTGPELPPGMQLSESGAIVRHLARQNGLDGADAGERCQADMIFEASKGIPLIVGGWRADDALLADGDLSRMQAQLTRSLKTTQACCDLFTGLVFTKDRLHHAKPLPPL